MCESDIGKGIMQGTSRMQVNACGISCVVP